jgi:hypothetical protein
MRFLVSFLVASLLVTVPPSVAGASPSGGETHAKKKKCPPGYVRKGKRCRKKPKKNTKIVSGRYEDMNGFFYFDVDTKANSIKYWFSWPCTTGNPETISSSHFSNRDEPIGVGLPGEKVGTKLAISGQRVEDSNAYPGARVSYEWTIDAKFTRRNVLSGTMHVSSDLPPYNGEFTHTGSHCEEDVPVNTAAPLR